MGSLILSACLAFGAYQHSDAFDYPDGSEGAPTWSADTIPWEIRNAQFLVEGGAASFAVLQSAPHGQRVTAEVTLVVDRRTPGQWATAGIAIRRDDRNYWHLALVEAPESAGRRHFVELQESLNGQWLAQSHVSKLTPTSFVGADFAWLYGKPYRLRIAMTPEGIEGTVSEPDGALRSKLGYRFDNQAVTSGQPALDNGAFVARFDDFVAHVDDVVPPPAPPTTPIKPYTLRGYDGVHAKPTGFFRPEQIEGKWWMIDPTGRGFYMVGSAPISFHAHPCEKLGYAPYHRNMQAKYGGEALWADAVAAQLKTWGFNTLPANHSPLLRYRDFAHILFLAWGSEFSSMDDIVPRTTWTGVPNVFSPKWPRYCDKMARLHCAPNRGDPWLIGYFIDNELEWYGKNYAPWGVFAEAWKKPAGHSAKQAWLTFVREQINDVGTFNTHWGTHLDSLDALAAHTNPGSPQCDAAHNLARGFLRLVADRYFRVAAEAIRRHDGNHLVLGCRFAGDAPDFWDIAGKYSDIVSLNTYPRIDVDRGVPADLLAFLKERYEKCRRPMMITEWSFPALDAGLPSKHGAGMRVDTQAQKARCFDFYQTFLFSLPFMVGSNYFMWVDEPAEGISRTFPEDSNYGLVNVQGVPYKLLTDVCTRLNPRACELHGLGQVRIAGTPKPADWLTRAPKEAPASRPHSFDLTMGQMRLSGPSGGAACRITLSERPLGHFSCMIHQRTAHHYWIMADQARLVAIHRQPDMTTIDLVLSYGDLGPEAGTERPKSERGDQRPDRPVRYRAGWRLRVLARPVSVPCFAAECLWVENIDSIPMDIAEVLYWVAPNIGGSPDGDLSDAPGVPSYYLPAAGWMDRKVGMGIGTTYLSESDFTCNYWRDKGGGIHSDLCLNVGQKLAPHQRYTPNASPILVFAYTAEQSLANAAGHVRSAALEPHAQEGR